jgi:hypothetical protein
VAVIGTAKAVPFPETFMRRGMVQANLGYEQVC